MKSSHTHALCSTIQVPHGINIMLHLLIIQFCITVLCFALIATLKRSLPTLTSKLTDIIMNEFTKF